MTRQWLMLLEILNTAPYLTNAAPCRVGFKKDSISSYDDRKKFSIAFVELEPHVIFTQALYTPYYQGADMRLGASVKSPTKALRQLLPAAQFESIANFFALVGSVWDFAFIWTMGGMSAHLYIQDSILEISIGSSLGIPESSQSWLEEVVRYLHRLEEFTVLDLRDQGKPWLELVAPMPSPSNLEPSADSPFANIDLVSIGRSDFQSQVRRSFEATDNQIGLVRSGRLLQAKIGIHPCGTIRNGAIRNGAIQAPQMGHLITNEFGERFYYLWPMERESTSKPYSCVLIKDHSQQDPDPAHRLRNHIQFAKIVD